jgi:hypothetical protein
VVNFKKPSKPQLGLRYIPEFSLGFQLSESTTLDTEFSANAFVTALFEEISDVQKEVTEALRFRLKLTVLEYAKLPCTMTEAMSFKPNFMLVRADVREGQTETYERVRPTLLIENK